MQTPPRGVAGNSPVRSGEAKFARVVVRRVPGDASGACWGAGEEFLAALSWGGGGLPWWWRWWWWQRLWWWWWAAGPVVAVGSWAGSGGVAAWAGCGWLAGDCPVAAVGCWAGGAVGAVVVVGMAKEEHRRKGVYRTMLRQVRLTTDQPVDNSHLSNTNP